MTDLPSSTARPLRIRRAVRALILAPQERVLLVRFVFPRGEVWALPGGGIEAGETPDEALRRELAEEVGMLEPRIGPHVWSRASRVPFVSGLFDGQDDQIHLVEVPDVFEPTPRLTAAQLQAEYVFELRWWSLGEIERAPGLVITPSDIALHLRRLVTDGPPSTAITVTV